MKTSATAGRFLGATLSCDADAVHELIMATADHIHAKASEERYPGFSNDLDLFLDLDLSPVAAPWLEFAANSQKLRFEYSWLPEAVFYLGQIAMLEKFANNNARLFRRTETRQAWRITPQVEKWRHGHLHDTPPYPFMPSPTFAIALCLA